MRMSDISESPSDKATPEPIFEKYQLIGDSQFLRFAESKLTLKRKEKDGYSCLGLCVSGQRIEHLLDRVKNGFGVVSERVVLMIGTNDLLGGTTFEKMRENYKELLELLSKVAKNMILLTLPPVLKLKKSPYHWSRLKKFNEFIKEFHDDKTFFVGNAYPEFVCPKESSNTTLNSTNSVKDLDSVPMCDSEDDSICSINGDGQSKPSHSPIDDTFFRPYSKTPEARQQRRFSNWKSNHINYYRRKVPAAAARSAPIPSSGDTALASSDGATKLFSDSVVTVSGVGEALSHLGDAKIAPNSAVPLSGSTSPEGATTFSGAVETPDDQTAPFDDTTSLRDDTSTLSCPVEATLLSGSEMSPDSMTAPSDCGISPSGGSVTPNATSPGNASTPASGAADSAKTPSDGGMSPSGRGMPSSSGKNGDFATPSSGELPLKRKHTSNSNDKRHVKRKRFSYPTDGRPSHWSELGSTDEVEIENADTIRAELFEQYYDNDCRRPDLIHLNSKGLDIIEQIIRNSIVVIPVEKAEAEDDEVVLVI